MTRGGTSTKKRLKQTTLVEYFPVVAQFRPYESEPIYVEIQRNIGDLQQTEWTQEKCCCARSCGKACRNRVRRIECDQTTCNLGICANRPWQQYQADTVSVEVRATEGRGLGVF
ncbi:Histone-lysine N-methyltransferase [Phytophthora megakarya]|uniref:Histone-lysine N-methyltransferase n=1 Tax=Phytophthora megakarya TaxID=4795 RepID=A0A225UES7_9STRA|nr:Histone-lysine N-methyltransferase [Phytophthora megakarya]